MAVKVDKKITGYEVVKDQEPVTETQEGNVTSIAPLLERDAILEGSTYKIKTPHSEHAMYVTINDIVTPNGQRRPFEMFINTKNMEHFMWIVTLTRIVSAMFRKGGEITFLVEELKAVFDPRGGYYKKGGVYMPSVVAEIGACLEEHFISIGMIEKEVSPELEAKREEAKEKLGEDALQGASQCAKCSAFSVVLMDGCQTCLDCGNSKCG